jgi:hypothetical protein
MEQTIIGTAKLASAPILECTKPPVKAAFLLSFKSEPELFDDQRTRLPLARAKEMQRVVGACAAEVELLHA